MFNAKKLEEYLESNGLSQAKFGEKVGISATMVFYLIKGYKQPSALLLRRIADVLDCSMDELMSEEV